jgi:hypothetical protein
MLQKHKTQRGGNTMTKNNCTRKAGKIIQINEEFVMRGDMRGQRDGKTQEQVITTGSFKRGQGKWN